MCSDTERRGVPGLGSGLGLLSGQLVVCALILVACAASDTQVVQRDRAIVMAVFRACKQAYLSSGVARRAAEASLRDLCADEQAASAFARALSGEADFTIEAWRVRRVPMKDREESPCSERFELPPRPQQAARGEPSAPATQHAEWNRRLEIEARLGRQDDGVGLSTLTIAAVLPPTFAQDDLVQILSSAFGLGLFRIRLEDPDYSRLRLIYLPNLEQQK